MENNKNRKYSRFRDLFSVVIRKFEKITQSKYVSSSGERIFFTSGVFFFTAAVG